MSEDAAVSLVGEIALRPIAAGSHSAREAPVLVDEAGRAHRLHLVGDNPFEEPSLRALVGRRVKVRGELRNDTLRVLPEDLEREG